MKILFSKRIQKQSINLTQYIHDKAKAFQFNDLIDLAIGFPCENINKNLQDGAIRALKSNKTIYSATAGIPELRKIIAKDRLRYNKKDNVLITAGASEAVFLVIASLVNPWDEVIIISPAYFIFQNCVNFCGGKSVFVPLKISGSKFYLDIKEIKKKITAKTKLIVFNSPHNPTGWVADKKTIEELSKIADCRGITILSDEIYKNYIYNRKFYSPEEFTKNVIVVDGISKSFSATGLRIGWIVAEKNVIEKILPLHQLILFCAPTPFQYAAHDLFKNNYKASLKKHIDQYKLKRNLVFNLLSKISEVEVIKPEGTFYMFLRLKNYKNSIEFSEKLLLSKHIVVVPGLDYGKEWGNFVRIAYREPKNKIKEACLRFKEFVS